MTETRTGTPTKVTVSGIATPYLHMVESCAHVFLIVAYEIFVPVLLIKRLKARTFSCSIRRIENDFTTIHVSTHLEAHGPQKKAKESTIALCQQ